MLLSIKLNDLRGVHISNNILFTCNFQHQFNAYVVRYRGNLCRIPLRDDEWQCTQCNLYTELIGILNLLEPHIIQSYQEIKTFIHNDSGQNGATMQKHFSIGNRARLFCRSIQQRHDTNLHYYKRNSVRKCQLIKHDRQDELWLANV